MSCLSVSHISAEKINQSLGTKHITASMRIHNLAIHRLTRRLIPSQGNKRSKVKNASYCQSKPTHRSYALFTCANEIGGFCTKPWLSKSANAFGARARLKHRQPSGNPGCFGNRGMRGMHTFMKPKRCFCVCVCVRMSGT